MAATIFHWALYPWAIYSAVPLSLALFAFNKGQPITLRLIFYTIFGERVWGRPGHAVDMLAVFATLFRRSTSLAIGPQLTSAGLEFLFGTPSTPSEMVVLIIFITAIATVSVVAGIDKGVKQLSELNMGLAL